MIMLQNWSLFIAFELHSISSISIFYFNINAFDSLIFLHISALALVLLVLSSLIWLGLTLHWLWRGSDRGITVVLGYSDIQYVIRCRCNLSILLHSTQSKLVWVMDVSCMISPDWGNHVESQCRAFMLALFAWVFSVQSCAELVSTTSSSFNFGHYDTTIANCMDYNYKTSPQMSLIHSFKKFTKIR